MALAVGAGNTDCGSRIILGVNTGHRSVDRLTQWTDNPPEDIAAGQQPGLCLFFPGLYLSLSHVLLFFIGERLIGGGFFADQLVQLVDKLVVLINELLHILGDCFGVLSDGYRGSLADFSIVEGVVDTGYLQVVLIKVLILLAVDSDGGVRSGYTGFTACIKGQFRTHGPVLRLGEL